MTVSLRCLGNKSSKILHLERKKLVDNKTGTNDKQLHGWVGFQANNMFKYFHRIWATRQYRTQGRKILWVRTKLKTFQLMKMSMIDVVQVNGRTFLNIMSHEVDITMGHNPVGFAQHYVLYPKPEPCVESGTSCIRKCLLKNLKRLHSRAHFMLNILLYTCNAATACLCWKTLNQRQHQKCFSNHQTNSQIRVQISQGSL